MHLIAIKPTLRPNRVNLWFDHQKYLPFFIDDFVSLNLQKNEPLTVDQLTEISHRSAFFLAKEFCLRQISLSPKIKKILTPKLKRFLSKIKYKYYYPVAVDDDEIIASCFSYLESQNLLDEAKFVDYYFKRYPHKSQNELFFRLKQLGISILPTNRQNDADSDKEKIINILRKKKITAQIRRNYQAKNRLYSYLYRKGFSLSQVKSVIDEYLVSG